MKHQIIAAVLLVLMSLQTSFAEPQPIPEDGFYPVVRESLERESIGRLEHPHVVVVHDPSILDGGDTKKVYLVIDRTECAPFELKQEPEKRADETERTKFWLGVTLSDSAGRKLEQITRSHLGGTLAVVVGGKSVTKHGIKSVITGGKLQISRCGDNGCEVLFRELEDNLERNGWFW